MSPPHKFAASPDEGRPHPDGAMRTNFSTYRGVRVVLLDFSNVSDDETGLALIAEAKEVISKQRPKSLYSITDVTGSRVTPRMRTALHELALADAPFVISGVVVGLTKLQMVILRGIVQLTKRRLVPAASREEALEWIAKEAEKQRAS